MGRFSRQTDESGWLPVRRRAAAAVVWAAMLLLAAGPAPAQDASPVTVELRYSSGADAAAMITPAKALTGGKPFTINGASGSLSVAGSPVTFTVTWHEGQKAFYGGMDADGDGKVAGREFVKFDNSMGATFRVRAGGKTHVVRVANVYPYVRTTGGGGIASVKGGYAVCGYYRGVGAGDTIRLFDEDLDGKISQDGADAIMIGRSGAAIPLKTTHQVGGRHYTVSVAEDGSSITLTPLADSAVGIVKTNFRRGLKVLALADKEGRCYDIVASGATGIPAGSYKLVYGVLTDGKGVAIIKPTDKCPTYEIQAGKINTLRIGAPLWVSFSASVRGGNVSVYPGVKIYGAGYEEYSFDMSGGPGLPRILMLEGSTPLSNESMEFG